MVLEKIIENPLDYKEIQPVHPKENQSWIFIGSTEAEVETPIFWLKGWIKGENWMRIGHIFLIPPLIVQTILWNSVWYGGAERSGRLEPTTATRVRCFYWPCPDKKILTEQERILSVLLTFNLQLLCHLLAEPIKMVNWLKKSVIYKVLTNGNLIDV